MSMIKISFPGIPIPQGRPRFARGYFYDPCSSEKKALLPLLHSQLHPLKEPLKGPIWLHATFFFPFPKTSSKAFVEGSFHQHRDRKPDLDNVLKFYLDLFTGIVYEDDSQICYITAQKVFGPEGVTQILVSTEEIKVAIEHVICYKKELTQEDIFVIARKAHTLGLSGRDILRTFTNEDSEGKHLFFEVEGLREKKLLI